MLVWLYPHIDCGKCQYSAAHFLGDSQYDYKHGDLVEFYDWMKKSMVKGVFRIIDKDYDKGWLRSNMPALKQEWKRRVENNA